MALAMVLSRSLSAPMQMAAVSRLKSVIDRLLHGDDNEINNSPGLGRVDEFGSDEIFGIPRLNQA